MSELQSEDIAENLKRVWKKSIDDYQITAAQKPHSANSIKKRAPEFVGDIQTMIDNDPSKSIRSIAKDMGWYEFLIRQVVHEDIWYFLYKIRRGQFLSQAMKNKAFE